MKIWKLHACPALKVTFHGDKCIDCSAILERQYRMSSDHVICWLSSCEHEGSYLHVCWSRLCYVYFQFQIFSKRCHFKGFPRNLNEMYNFIKKTICGSFAWLMRLKFQVLSTDQYCSVVLCGIMWQINSLKAFNCQKWWVFS